MFRTPMCSLIESSSCTSVPTAAARPNSQSDQEKHCHLEGAMPRVGPDTPTLAPLRLSAAGSGVLARTARYRNGWTTSPTHSASTGASNIYVALIAARHQLPGAHSQDDVPVRS